MAGLFLAVEGLHAYALLSIALDGVQFTPLNSMQGSGGQKPLTMCLPDSWPSSRTEAGGDEDSPFVLTLVEVLCVKALNLGLVLGQVSSVLARILLGQFSKNPALSYVMKFLTPL